MQDYWSKVQLDVRSVTLNGDRRRGLGATARQYREVGGSKEMTSVLINDT